MKPAGVILCGGASRRMGRDKATLAVDGEPLIRRTVRIMCESVDRVLIAAGPEQSLPTLDPKALVVRDLVAHTGPLAGIAAALPECTGFRHVLVMPCDCPAMTQGTIEWMLARLLPGRSLFVKTHEIVHPLPAVYCLDGLHDKINRLTGMGRCSLKGLMSLLAYDVVTDPPDEAVFAPCNTPEEFEQAIRHPGSIRE
ncbi:MAG: molybdenum cofactor guanylyltransferase [Gemmataceae bacterium]|nr:molybdenum cofactor guanylyltransferase [Gemmataceae bacterium]